MAARKATKAAEPKSKDIEPSPYTVEGPSFVQGMVHFSGNDLVRHELLQAKVENTYLAIHNTKFKLEETKRRLALEVQVLEDHLKELVRISKEREGKLKLYQDRLSEVYDVDLSKVTYDDETGKIFSEEGVAVPHRKK